MKRIRILSAVFCAALLSACVMIQGPSASSDARLASLALSGVDLNPVFSAETVTYSASVPYAADRITISAGAESDKAVISFDPVPISATASSAIIALSVGVNTAKISVKAEDGTIRVYTISITRASQGSLPSSDARLAFLSISGVVLNPVFFAETVTYSASVPYAADRITISAGTENAKAAVTFDPVPVLVTSSSATVALSVGANAVKISVKAEDGTIRVYTITVTRASPGTDSSLSGLSLSSGRLLQNFSPSRQSYLAEVPFSVSSVSFTPTANGLGAQIRVNGQAVASGAASSAIALSASGKTPVSIQVTAEDGSTTSTYTLNVRNDLVASWPLRADLNDYSGNGYNGTWVGDALSTSPQFVTQDGLSGVHFRYSEAEPTPAGIGDHIEGETGSNWHSELAASDVLTVAFRLYWDPDVMQLYDGSALAADNEFMNIVNKCRWNDSGWQLRQISTVGVGEAANLNDINLFIHHNNAGAPYGDYESFEIVDGKTFGDSLGSSYGNTYRGSWHHFVVCIDNVNLVVKTYIDGAFWGTTTYGHAFTAVAQTSDEFFTNRFTIGSFSHPWGGFPVNGKMRDVRFYHGLLDADDAAALSVEN